MVPTALAWSMVVGLMEASGSVRETLLRSVTLGTTDLRPSVLGFGCYHVGAPSRDRKEIEATLRSAFERGITYYDTADVYDDGESERVLGRVFRGDRDRVIICSKSGKRFDPALKTVLRVSPYVKSNRSSCASAPGGG